MLNIPAYSAKTFSNGDALTAADMNKIESALQGYAGNLQSHDQTLEGVISGIRVMTETEVQNMIDSIENES